MHARLGGDGTGPTDFRQSGALDQRLGGRADAEPRSKDWLEGFDTFQSELKERISARFALAGDDAGRQAEGAGYEVGRPVDARDLQALAAEVARALHINAWLGEAEIRIKSVQISDKRDASGDDLDVLNSFYLNDLSRVARASHGEALASYLREQLDEAARVDVREDPKLWRTQLSPDRFPVGRWPSAGHHPLVFSQQLAVNALTQRLQSAAGLYAVNGPPGTGKTTAAA